MIYTHPQLQAETDRLFTLLQKTKRTREQCFAIADITLEINNLKKEKNAVILSHSYQIPEIMYGVADHVGDSFGLSKLARNLDAETIVFCSVHFMGETAKILNTEKKVLVPSRAGCSLASSITAQDVLQLREKYPEAGIVCYVNTSAEVKAESDVCCTSSNALSIINVLPQDTVIFLPDMLMGKNLQKLTTKKLILWNGTCVVHEAFDAEAVRRVRQKFPDVKILAHYECAPSVIADVDMVGSTGDMMAYVKQTSATHLMLITECGITDRIRIEYPSKIIVGSCQLCPFMKQITLDDILQALKEPRPDQIVSVEHDVLVRARMSLTKMMDMSV